MSYFDSRRQFLQDVTGGFGKIALAGLLARDVFASESSQLLGPRTSQLPTKAKSCIFLFQQGGPSSIDTFDYKPELNRRHDEKLDEQRLIGTPRKMRRCGESGQWCSDTLPYLAQRMDDIAVVKSLYCETSAHNPAMILMNTGKIMQGHPALGSWLTYGLGTVNENLPGFVVMNANQRQDVVSPLHWSAGYMPASYQGTMLRMQGQPIHNLRLANGTSASQQRQQIDVINRLNREHLNARQGYSELEARIASYELAFRLQSTAPEALDIADEPAYIRELYGLDATSYKANHYDDQDRQQYAKGCLIARRLVERGVRFVQLFYSGWDSHNESNDMQAARCREIDQATAALLSDLKQRGLLDETLVVWGGEFGREPFEQGDEGGRNHNADGFLYWLAGAGIKGGTSYGETDEIGHKASVDRHHVRDLHATVLHLMGLDHERLSYLFGGIEQRMTGPKEAHVIQGIVA